MIKVQINGEERLVESLNVEELVRELDLPDIGIAIEKNKALIPRANFSESEIVEGDRIEIVQFVGGG